MREFVTHYTCQIFSWIVKEIRNVQILVIQLKQAGIKFGFERYFRNFDMANYLRNSYSFFISKRMNAI